MHSLETYRHGYYCWIVGVIDIKATHYPQPLPSPCCACSRCHALAAIASRALLTNRFSSEGSLMASPLTMLSQISFAQPSTMSGTFIALKSSKVFALYLSHQESARRMKQKFRNSTDQKHHPPPTLSFLVRLGCIYVRRHSGVRY